MSKKIPKVQKTKTKKAYYCACVSAWVVDVDLVQLFINVSIQNSLLGVWASTYTDSFVAVSVRECNRH